MQSFKSSSPCPEFYSQSSFCFRSEERGGNLARSEDLRELSHSTTEKTIHQNDAVHLRSNSIVSSKLSSLSGFPINRTQNALNQSIGASEIAHTGTGCLDTGQQLMYSNVNFENWGDSAMADNSQQTDTSTDIENDDRNQFQAHHGTLANFDSLDQSKPKAGDQKALRRLAQNREAARKSRLRKKAYVQQLETSQLKLAQLEQELQRTRQQGMFNANGFSGDHAPSLSSNGAMAFDAEYARWLDEHHRLIDDLRSAANSHMGDNELRFLVDSIMTHYDELFRLKSIGAKRDVFYMLSGMWKTPAERCFMWLGGFRSSDLLKILGNHLELLTDQQLMGICNLQQSSQQAEDALSQGMEALQQSLLETLTDSAALGHPGPGNVADYMGQMVIAMEKLSILESFIHQADLLRQQTLQQLHRILTSRQAARALMCISDYNTRLRALSSLWLARPRDLN